MIVNCPNCNTLILVPVNDRITKLNYMVQCNKCYNVIEVAYEAKAIGKLKPPPEKKRDEG